MSPGRIRRRSSDGSPSPLDLATAETLPPSKTKVVRTHYNCEECRRSKSKCDRSWPCSACIRKGIPHLCPSGVSSTAPSKSKTITLLSNRIKVLEDQLLRIKQETHGAANTADKLLSNSQDEENQVIEGVVRPFEMSAILDEIALGSSSSKRYAGTEASPFYLDTPQDSEDEETANNTFGSNNPFTRSKRRHQDQTMLVPWAHRGGLAPCGTAELPKALLDRCTDLLPGKKEAEEMFERYWELLTWRTQPMTRSFFLNTILPNIYDTDNGPHPHELAVLLSTMALTELFNSDLKRNGPSPTANDCYEAAYACLVAGQFFTNTTLSSLVTLQHIGTYMLNSDDRKLPDGNFAVFGLAVRLAIIAGYHRDPSVMHRSMSLEGMDMRRRIWHELLASDRLHSLPALLPNSIDLNHYDAKLPSDALPRGYFVFKWKIGVFTSRVVEYWTSSTIPPYSVLQDIDAGLRMLLQNLPAGLRCPHLASRTFSLPNNSESTPIDIVRDITDQAEPTIDPSILAKQQIRLAMHFCMLFFYLHRTYFIRSFAGDQMSHQLSTDTIIEACENVVILTEAVMNVNWALSRWFSFAADLFSVLHCQTVLIVKTKEPELAARRIVVLEKGVEILRWISQVRPNSKNRALLQGAMRLLANANQSRTSTSVQGFSPLWGNFINLTSLSGNDNSAMDSGVAPAMNGPGSLVMPGPTQGPAAQCSESFDVFLANLLQMTNDLPVQLPMTNEACDDPSSDPMDFLDL